VAELYPEQNPYESGYLDVGDGHQLAFNRYGNPKGKPVVYLHGGPGAGTSWEYRLFDPMHYNILLFDQRGAGHSKPYGEIQNNSIETLVADIEKFRIATGVDKWDITGGSWGSALAMFYTTAHPERVGRVLLRGVFFADKKGAKHIIEADGSAAHNRNSLFDEYENFIPRDERVHGLMLPYYQRLIHGSPAVALEAARLFDRWDTSIATYELKPAWLEDINASPMNSLALSRLFFHFSVNHFHDDRRAQLLMAMARIDSPVFIVHGRQDHICPVENAILLDRFCKRSTLAIIDKCGHAMGEPELASAFIAVTDGWLRADLQTQAVPTRDTPRP